VIKVTRQAQKLTAFFWQFFMPASLNMLNRLLKFSLNGMLRRPSGTHLRFQAIATLETC